LDYPIVPLSNSEETEDEKIYQTDDELIEEPIIPPKKVFIRDVKNKRRRIFR
jgi:hypothetical protein